MAAGQQQAQTQSMKGAAQVGAIKAAEAANGVDVNTGSAVDVQSSQREENELSTSNTLNNAALQAYGYRTQAVNDTAQAGLEEAASEQDITGSELGATGGLLSSVGALGSKWSQGGSTFNLGGVVRAVSGLPSSGLFNT